VVAWNNDNTLKDITKRYCTNFNTVTRKLRIDAVVGEHAEIVHWKGNCQG
jgi:hypothetical protein